MRFSRVWMVVPAAALGFLIWLNFARVARIESISAVVPTELAPDAASPTGYANGQRLLLIPEHNDESCQWIEQTQLMLARHEWRLRHVSYDNAPAGREVRTPSPYRWWLAFVARADRLFTGRPPGLAVEHASLAADPTLHVLLVLAVTGFAAVRFGWVTGAVLAVALVGLFPFAGNFLPGQPGDTALLAGCVLASVLPLLAALLPQRGAAETTAPTGSANPRWFFLAGMAGGLGLWIDAPKEFGVVLGLAAGGLAAALFPRARDGAPAAPAWRAWALGGTLTALLAFVIEYFPDHATGWNLDQNHPLYAIAWLGLGELLARASTWGRGGKNSSRVRAGLAIGLAVVAVAAVFVVPAWLKTSGWLAAENLATRLTNLPGSPVAADSGAWIMHDGVSLADAATFLPLLWLPGIAVLLIWSGPSSRQRTALALAAGPALVFIGIALFRLRWWNLADAALLATLAALVAVIDSAIKSLAARVIALAGAVLCLIPSLILLAAQGGEAGHKEVSAIEVQSLVERDLAQWLGTQAGPDGAVVLASPRLTSALIYYGGVSGLGTPFAENQEGFLASLRVAGATSPDEAQAIARSHQLRYIVVPSWDTFLDDYARLGANQAEHSLISLLHRWVPPRWLQPVPYPLPKVEGFEGQSVAIFEVVDVQDNATALSHLAEYFIEMDEIGRAAAAGQALQKFFPADASAIVARTLVEQAVAARTQQPAPATDLFAMVQRGDDHDLAWDRRVSLAIALMQAKDADKAAAQVRQCVAEITEANLRSLSTVSLYRLLLLARRFGIAIPDAHLQQVALGLLPKVMRDELH